MTIKVEYYKNTTQYEYNENLEIIPRVGEIIMNEQIKNLGSTGIFMVFDVWHNQTTQTTIVEVEELTTTTDIEQFRKNLLKEAGYI